MVDPSMLMAAGGGGGGGGMDLVGGLGGLSGGGSGGGPLAMLKHKLSGAMQGFGSGVASLNPTISKAYNAGQGGEGEDFGQNVLRDRVAGRQASLDAETMASSQPSESPQAGQTLGAIERLKRYGMNPVKGGY